MFRIAVVSFLVAAFMLAQPRLDAAASAVRFRLASPNAPLLLVDVRVNGKGPFTFVIDTGARTCIIDPELAHQTEIAPTSWEERLGAGGSVRIGIGTASSIAIGEYDQSNVEVGISDELHRISVAVGTEIRGAIGFNYLHHYRVKLDFSRLQLTLATEAANAEPGNSVQFALAGKKPLITLPVFVNGQGPFTFVLDTGASATAISEDLAKRLAIRLTQSPGRAVGAGSSNINIRIASLDTLSVGGAVVSKLPVGVVTFLGPISEKIGRQIDGVVGFDYLHNFDCIIDYLDERFILQPRQESPVSRSQ